MDAFIIINFTISVYDYSFTIGRGYDYSIVLIGDS